MTQLFLKAKHWHLFLLTFGIPMILQFVMMGTIFTQIVSNSTPDPSSIANYSIPLYSGVIIFIIVILGGWFWSVTIGLQPKINPKTSMNLSRFKIFFFVPLIYFLLFSVIINTQIIATEFLILPLHLFSMFCIFHSMYFAAKTIKTVELQREVSFSDFAGEFFLIWFFPIGIWILQPRLNALISSKD